MARDPRSPRTPRERLSPEALALGYLRSERGWRQKDLAARLGLSDSRQISRYESGQRALSREMLDSIAAVLDYPREAVDALIAHHAWISGEVREDDSPLALTPGESRRIDRAALAAGTAVAGGVHSYLVQKKKRGKAKAARQRAGDLWDQLKPLSSQKRRETVVGSPEFLSWALVERLCEESVRAAADDPRKSLDLADLALVIADRVEGQEGWRNRLKGYAWAHHANARRVANDFAGADKEFSQAKNLWQNGAASDPGLLQEWRVLSLEASLRREQHRFPEALDLLDRAALATGGDPVATGRILLNKEQVFEEIGDTENALIVLSQARSFIEASGEPRLLFVLHFKTAKNLCHVERFIEAAEVLPGVREIAITQGNELDLLRVTWLESRLATGQGLKNDAIACLERVRRGFTARQLPYDAARASLELAALWLEKGRTAEVRSLSLAMVWIFKAQGIAREALAALAIFCDAAQKETATIEVIREVLAEVERARRSAPPPRAAQRG